MTIESKSDQLVKSRNVNPSKVGAAASAPSKIPIKQASTVVVKEERESQEKDDTKTEAEAGKENEVPKGKISCLLCRGFISYKNSDRYL